MRLKKAIADAKYVRISYFEYWDHNCPHKYFQCGTGYAKAKYTSRYSKHVAISYCIELKWANKWAGVGLHWVGRALRELESISSEWWLEWLMSAGHLITVEEIEPLSL